MRAPAVPRGRTALYIASDAANPAARTLGRRGVSLRLCRGAPARLWTSTGPTQSSARSSFHALRCVGRGPGLFHDVVIDKATGAQTQAPGGQIFPLALADDVAGDVLDHDATCSGVDAQAASGRTWTTSTASTQSGYGCVTADLGYAPAGFSRSQERLTPRSGSHRRNVSDPQRPYRRAATLNLMRQN